MAKPRTLYDKIWDDHLVHEAEDGTCLLYIDRHLVHEVTSPQAFEGLRLSGRKVRHPEKTLAVVDHNVPTTDRSKGIAEPESRTQIETLAQNAKDFGVEYYDEHDRRQGIVHVIGPEQGFTLPGTTIVCGDSHTSTHGAFGALAHGIGTSEVEHVLATQTLIQKKAKNMLVQVDGKLAPGATAKDIILAIIGQIGTAGGTGSVIEYAGDAIRELSMEGRMTVCNMSIEGGARAGMIAPDETAYAYLKGRPKAPKGADWDAARRYWDTLSTDAQATRSPPRRPRDIQAASSRRPSAEPHGGHPQAGSVRRLHGDRRQQRHPERLRLRVQFAGKRRNVDAPKLAVAFTGHGADGQVVAIGQPGLDGARRLDQHQVVVERMRAAHRDADQRADRQQNRRDHRERDDHLDKREAGAAARALRTR